MKRENARFVVCEDGCVLGIREAVGVVAVGLKLEKIDDIDEANLNFRKVLAKQSSSGKSLLCADITAAGHDKVGFLVLAV